MTGPRQGSAMSTLRLTGAQRRLMQKLAHRGWPGWQRRKPPPIPPGSSHTPEIEARLRKAAGARP